MTSKSSNSSFAPVPLHCQHRSPSGRRCRLPLADPSSTLCLRHAVHRQKVRDAADLAVALTGQSDDFQTAAGIHHSLSELYRLLARNCISPRRAAVLAYISQLLLRTLPAIGQERDPGSSPEATGPVIVVDVPRPIRTQDGQPS
ncbi:MAG: hypothetical protein LAN84_10310 [Acidobacteriia bacterium]|nr:hypothetical protein [Terriglobia bacterium]